MPVVLEVLSSGHELLWRELQKMSNILPRLSSGDFLRATHPYNANKQLYSTDRPPSYEWVGIEGQTVLLIPLSDGPQQLFWVVRALLRLLSANCSHLMC
jgi:hypothetical protein